MSFNLQLIAYYTKRAFFVLGIMLVTREVLATKGCLFMLCVYVFVFFL